MHFQSFGRSRIVNFLGFILISLLGYMNHKVIVTMHNFADKVDLEKVSVRPSMINKLGLTFAMRALITAESIAVTVPSYQKYLKDEYGYDRSVYLRHGTSVNTEDNYNTDCQGTRKLLFFGHMAPHKGLPVMLEAYSMIRTERDDVELIVAGTDHPNFQGYLSNFNLESHEGVQYLGYIPDENLMKVFTDSSIVILPYLTTTGTSGVFHLACGAGKPIVSSDHPEIRELLSEGASASLARPGDPVDLKERILNLLEKPEKMEKMAQRNLSYAKTESWETVASDYVKTYKKILNRK
jgi:glycosyltransferase involved in cell wall biosynthesis